MRPTNVRWFVFVLGCGISFTVYLHRYTFALIKPELQRRFNLDLIELGALDSAFSISYMVVQFPAGILADVLGAHLFLGSIVLLWSAALAMHAWAPTVLMLTYARMLFGAAQSAAFAAINRVARTWFPFSIRTTVQGWMGTFFPRAGGASANLLFATVLMGWLLFSWQAAIYVFACIGVLFGLFFLLFFRNSPRRHPWVNQQEADLIEAEDRPAAGAPRMTVKEMFRRMSPRSITNLLCLNLQSTLSTIADNIYSNWMPLFLYQVYKLNYAEMGIYSSLPLIGGAIGGATGGYLNDYLIRRTANRRWSRAGVAIAGKTLSGLLLLVAVLYLYDQPYLFCGLLFFVKFYSDWSLTTLWGTVTDIGGRATASVFAFNNSVASIGIVLAPLIYAYVAQEFGWPWVFVTAAFFCFLCAASWLFVDCTLPILREGPES